jgi:hypothetical protein
MKKVIRLTETEMTDLIEKIIKEEILQELDQRNFTNIRRIIQIEPKKSGLRVGVADMINGDEVKGESIVVYYIDNGIKKIFGYGPEIGVGVEKKNILSMGRKLLDQWSEEFEEMKL